MNFPPYRLLIYLWMQKTFQRASANYFYARTSFNMTNQNDKAHAHSRRSLCSLVPAAAFWEQKFSKRGESPFLPIYHYTEINNFFAKKRIFYLFNAKK